MLLLSTLNTDGFEHTVTMQLWAPPCWETFLKEKWILHWSFWLIFRIRGNIEVHKNCLILLSSAKLLVAFFYPADMRAETTFWGHSVGKFVLEPLGEGNHNMAEQVSFEVEIIYAWLDLCTLTKCTRKGSKYMRMIFRGVLWMLLHRKTEDCLDF